ncbi:hypothetical protein GCM10028784_20000 [Myceligenerans cantabricum]
MKQQPRSLVGGFLATLLVAAGLVVVPAIPASADEPPVPSLEDYRMRPANNADQLQERVELLDEQLPKLGVRNILAQAPRQGTTAAGEACNDDAVGALEPDITFSFCWDAADNAAGDGTYEWTPQGITTVADAQADKEWNGTQPLLVTWYQCHTVDGEKLCGDDDDSLCDRYDEECVKGVRVTFVDPDTGRYAHVLLAYPFINDSGNATYMSLRTQQTAAGESLHAGGVAWYGNYLYVADTARGVRVFDMRYIFDLEAAGEKGDTSDKHQIGRQDGVFYGHGYRYVMPEVAAYTNNVPRPPAAERCTNAGSPNTSFVSIDRSGIDHLITGEYCPGRTPEDGEAGGRVAAWPLDGSTGRPDINGTCTSRTPPHEQIPCWRADNAFALPAGVGNIQGATRYDGSWYLTQSNGMTNRSVLMTAVQETGETTGVLRFSLAGRPAGIGIEDLSYWPGDDPGRSGLWSLTEWWGKRMIYVTPREPR